MGQPEPEVTSLLKTYLDTTTITRATTITNSISTPPVTTTRPQLLSNSSSSSLPEAEVNTKEAASMTNIVRTPRLNYKTTLLQLF